MEWFKGVESLIGKKEAAPLYRDRGRGAPKARGEAPPPASCGDTGQLYEEAGGGDLICTGLRGLV